MVSQFLEHRTAYKNSKSKAKCCKIAKEAVMMMMMIGRFDLGLMILFGSLWPPSVSFRVSSTRTASSTSRNKHTLLSVGTAKGDYMVKEFSTMEQLEEIVKLASNPLPERPDGIVTVAKFTSTTVDNARSTEVEFDRMARKNPATLFIRCFQEYENANLVFGAAQISVIPTFDIFYGGNRVARVEGSNHLEVEEILERYQFQNSKLDLFSEASEKLWGDGKTRDPMKTPRTTNRFVPGYDWNSDKGFFDTAADKAQSDFEEQYGNWLPNTGDEK
uniref:Thioredoxin domain-containing protein n=2 Tax=Amphora coffeiformis TaxID=265554 RepID=A0A7S3P9R0_9STRA